jgi:DNA-binding transcriptional regulator YhcF (GntR family)
VLLQVNTSSSVPFSLQIEGQVKQAVAAGALKQGDALLSVRNLAIARRDSFTASERYLCHPPFARAARVA